MMCSEEPAYFQLPVFENRFTSNDLEQLLTFSQPSPNRNGDEPVSSNSGSDAPRSGAPDKMDQRKENRKISNRESARRSRWRKKRHFENLTASVSRLKAQNRDYRNRLSMILYQLHVVKRQNEQFRIECVGLFQRHSHLNRVLQFQRKRSVIDNSFHVQRFSY